MKYEVDTQHIKQYRKKATYKEHVKEAEKNPHLIPGIYNYCDRWCERCSFTARCMNFAIGEQQFADPSSRDINNEAFWETLAETFAGTLDMVKEMAEEQGIDLDTIDTETIKLEERIHEQVEDHEVCQAAEVYGQMVNEWFGSVEAAYQDLEEELDQKWALEMPRFNMEEETAYLKDAVEVIRWYQYQIHVKLMRAVRDELKDRPEELEGFPKDSDGSAKVALIGIDRSISAWDELAKNFPEQDDGVLKTLFHLERLRRNVERTFPNARAFVRPGFDEIPNNA